MRSAGRFYGSIWGVLAIGAICASPLAAQDEDEVDDPHGTLRVEIDCQACHTEAGWRPAKYPMEFDHDAQTDFPLRDSHQESDCATCHLELQFSEPQLATSDCAVCHVDVHLGNLSPDCQACHRETSFDDLDGPGLHTMTAFPLTGSHLQVTCETCHTDDRGGAFTTLNSDCFACHEEEYRRTGIVDHQAGGFPTDCRQCHTTVTWTGGVEFDHVTAGNGYPLIGAHFDLRCASCHVPPDGTLTFQPAGPDDCITCHQADYDREHAGTGIPTDCLGCHTNDTFSGADFRDHDAQFFPVYSGPHAGKWANDCTTCHTVPSDYKVFTCFSCHEHNQTEMDDKHSGESGYTYDNAECLRCHPDGRQE